MASVVDPPVIEALDDARRELGAALGELRMLGEELEEFANQSTGEIEQYCEALLGRDEELQAFHQQLTSREREMEALDESETSAARQLAQLEDSLNMTREELSQQRERGEGLEAELTKALRTATEFEQRLAAAPEPSASEATPEQQALLFAELESLRSHASQLEEELEEAHRISALSVPTPRPGQEAHLSGLIEQLTAVLAQSGAGIAPPPAAAPPPPSDGSSSVVGSLKEQFARLQMQAARRRESN